MAIRSDTVYLHSINLDAAANGPQQCWTLLDEAERSRACRFRSLALRRQWTAARAGLRDILASYCECSPAEIRFASGEFGKPELSGHIAATGVQFNLSHTGNMAMVAVSRGAELGVDIELRKRIGDWARVARRCFSPIENNDLHAVDVGRRMEVFFDCWTRKEAIIKATGEGLYARLDAFDVSLTPGAPTEVVADRSREQKYIGWRLEAIDLGRQYVGAIASPASVDMEHRYCGEWRFGHA